ncbi:hypothetical protein A2673_01660 [Candidatus Kaiserbacteria bacterium RIFCSPHIGHO2_01_FULL_50_13]|uniref:Glycosidase n=1 Tax=Candidatus Kaiserbacteria bacterium RIFCSPLOWO2_01_FULL_50_24 TaxID=1798507 RepID=A0A1F6EMH0_9BACT|nr:MAG: hypothetical protein A2673_01660 [Candidatus Kaiserbacteria bacterium RIFCSPHIGHO2_01_FULL_50_13]OGG74828.1 MAG: hypothetical protein A3A34_00360 [Candidatus Kaiserbacteria bacterium RIFCSPLOWO2_01_FULL_50_24]OGG81411.1 MAG: hypothetical protein A3H74_03145 [Candidatus Kaiserbacteria bacterium RIFCSPLOWO2_02_FULL_51_13]
MFVVRRSQHNPILSPTLEHAWEMASTNPCAILKDGKVHLLYRAIGRPDPMLSPPTAISTIGHATSEHGVHFENRKQFVAPSEEWDKYGCEDPRTTLFEGKYYTFYTAISQIPFRASGIKIGCAVSDDFERVVEKHAVTTFNSKAMTLFPERINGKVVAALTAHPDEPPQKFAIAEADRVEDFWCAPLAATPLTERTDFWDEWHKNIDAHSLPITRSGDDFVEVGAPPVKTKDGWLLIYSYIKNYFRGAERTFSVEALLLDMSDPMKIIGRTKWPIMVPEEPYELFGMVSNVIFPTGALVRDNRLDIYYGAADTVCARASLSLPQLLASIQEETRSVITRYEKNPIITPEPSHSWESRSTMNAAAIEIDSSIYILYRAMSEDNTSTIGLAISDNGFIVKERLPNPIYEPRADFEQKHGSSTGNSGCEDPRIVRLGDTLYMTYTAYDGAAPPRVAITSISVSDFLTRKFDRWKMPALATPDNVDDKDACVVPSSKSGEYFFFHRVNRRICVDIIDDLSMKKRVNRCIEIMGPRHGTWEEEKIGINGVPIKTKAGLLVFYHGIASDHHYRWGAALLDPNNPNIILGRTAEPIFEPEERYEIEGEVKNVVFSNGEVLRGDTIFIYYGGGDKVLNVATCSLKRILEILSPACLDGHHEAH